MVLRAIVVSCVLLLLSCQRSNEVPDSDDTKDPGLQFVDMEYEISEMGVRQDIHINQRNLAIVSIFQDSILYNREYIDEDSLSGKIRTFIKSDPLNSSLPQMRLTKFPVIGDQWVSDHLIILKMDTLTSYLRYAKVRHEIAIAYNSLRDEFAKEMFGMSYSDIVSSGDSAYSEYPMIIANKYPSRVLEVMRSGGK